MRDPAAFPWLEDEMAPVGAVALRQVFLHMTKACNMHCTYCYFSASQPLPDELSTAELTGLWKTLLGKSK